MLAATAILNGPVTGGPAGIQIAVAGFLSACGASKYTGPGSLGPGRAAAKAQQEGYNGRITSAPNPLAIASSGLWWCGSRFWSESLPQIKWLNRTPALDRPYGQLRTADRPISPARRRE